MCIRDSFILKIMTGQKITLSSYITILKQVFKNNVKKFVHTSTSEVYGSAQFTPIDEKHPINAQSPYAATKVAADQLVNSYRDTFGLNTITLRPFNTFGPRQSIRAVIPRIFSRKTRMPSLVTVQALGRE
mgnify:CR=1 FL=1